MITPNDYFRIIKPNFERCLWELYEEIKHGDEEHQKWLKDKIQEFIENKHQILSNERVYNIPNNQ
jgi:hypothetical protein